MTSSPPWAGNTGEFVVSASQQLQLNNNVGATSGLTTAFSTSALGITEWTFLIKLTFAPSSTNYARVYLVSDQQNLSSPLNGYFLQFGEANATDAIELFKQTGVTLTSICRGVNGSIANAFNVRVKVTKDGTGTWKVFTDYSGGTNYAQESTGTDNTITTSSYFGVRCSYTSTNGTKFFFDDFGLTMQTAPDLTAPVWNSVSIVSASSVQLVFSEAVDSISAKAVANYTLNNAAQPTKASLMADKKTVQLSFGSPFTNGTTQSLAVANVKDVAQNVMTSTTKTFLFFQPVASLYRDIVINELLPDPTPVIGLPEAEFVELYNRSTNPFDLSGWTITDGTSIGTLTSLILLPGEHVILSGGSSSALFQAFGKRMGLSIWPSLNNSGDLIKLKNPQGKTVDSVAYTIAWYQSEEKKDGGYSLELIDPENGCRGSSNWKASESLQGGTPGQVNSIFAIAHDVVSPRLVNVSPVSISEIKLQYDERLAKSALAPADFQINPPQTITATAFDDPDWQTIRLTFSGALDSTQTYTIANATVHDCPGNLIESTHASKSFKLDQTKPVVKSVKVIDANTISVSFDEKLDKTSAEASTNYLISEYAGAVTPQLQLSQSEVLLIFDLPLKNGFQHTLSLSAVTDKAGNTMDPVSQNFLFFEKQISSKQDLVITEIMADPTPPLMLPEVEYLEIFNRSKNPVNVKNWTLTDATSTATLPNFILLPDSFLILTSSTKASLFAATGKVVGVSGFPSLNNTGEPLVLRDENHFTIDSVHYSDSWYGSAEKKDGGYALERRDINDFCRDAANWGASNDQRGGTPGKRNSVDEIYLDTAPPQLIAVKSMKAAEIKLVFSEKLSVQSASAFNFIITPTNSIDSTGFADQTLSTVNLFFAQALDSVVTYQINVASVSDCVGNLLAVPTKVSFKLDQTKPTVKDVKLPNAKEIQITFSERVSRTSAEDISNYFVTLQNRIAAATLLPGDVTVSLQFLDSLKNGFQDTISVRAIIDLAQNKIDPIGVPFLFFEKKPTVEKDLIITEILADPSPTIGLPEAEFLELFNRSTKAFNLKNWTLSDATSTCLLPDVYVLPGEYLIVCSKTKASSFAISGKVAGVTSFPSLNNSGEPLVLRDDSGSRIDSLQYSDKWYGSSEKIDGGFSLELIDPEDFCRGSQNWIASTDSSGGTPGKRNSVYNIFKDVSGPKLLSISQTGLDILTLKYNERLSASSLSSEDILINQPTAIQSVHFANAEQREMVLRLNTPIDSALTYRIQTPHVHDCPGNLIEESFTSAVFRADTLPPAIREVVVLNQHEVKVLFSERINDKTTVQSFAIDTEIHPDGIVLSDNDNSAVLHFADGFQNGVKNMLTISSIADRAGNVSANTAIAFIFFQSSPTKRKDIIISEIFADPSPVIGLPEFEFVEIFNRSDNPIDLFNWKFSDGSSTTTLPSFILLPRAYALLCSSSKQKIFEQFGPAIGVAGFPSLTNAGEVLVLKNHLNETIDSVNYATSYYHDDEKKDGGWSIELIDPDNICAEESNWTASEDPRGGTPGGQNSVLASKPDLTGPRLLSAFAEDAATIVIQFDEKLELNAPDIGSFEIEPEIQIKDIHYLDIRHSTLALKATSILPKQLYTITATKVYDCAGNIIDAEFNSYSFALTEEADSLDVLVNEILFNPRPTGVDFVEVINGSDKFINLKNWRIANREEHLLYPENLLLKPGQILAFSNEPALVKSEYTQSHEKNILKAELPSFNDDEGSVVLLTPRGKMIDRFDYNESFHSPFLLDKEGVSLERISKDFSGQALSNWKSATEFVGFATPGFVNSNSFDAENRSSSAVAVLPEVFDPSGPSSGQPAFAEIQYNFDKGGYIANVNVIDCLGRHVKVVADNMLIGTKGFFRWDGDTENGGRVPTGSYMVAFDVFDESGSLMKFRKRVVVFASNR